jgi:hypothetical protein
MKTQKSKQKKTPRKAEYIFSEIDFPHIRLGGQWLTKNSSSSYSSFARACYYAAELQKAGLSDTFIAVMIQDLYWDCFQELEANDLIKKKKLNKLANGY